MRRGSLSALASLLVLLGCAGVPGAPGRHAPADDPAAWEDASRRSATGEPETGERVSGELRISGTGGRSPVEEGLCRVSRGGIAVAVRLRRDGSRRESWFCRAGDAGGVSLIAGDFIPRAGQGLLLGGGRSEYPFSAGYATGNRPGISPRVSWWDGTFRGAAATARAGGWSALAWAAGPRAGRGGTIVTLPERARGALLRRRAGSVVFGAGVVDGTAANGTVCGATCRIEEGTTHGLLEAAFSRGGTAWAAGVRLRGPVRAALLVYAVSRGFDNPLGRLPGNGLDSGETRRGCCATASRRLGRCRFSVALERLAESSGFRDREKRDRRVEWRCRWRRWEVRAAARRTIDERRDVFPWPAGAVATADERTSGSLRCRWTSPGGSGVAVAAGAAAERDGRAAYVAPVVTLAPGRGAAIRLGAAWWRGRRGIPLYLYERTVAGRYPWRRHDGDGRRLTATVEAGMWALRFAGWIAVEEGGSPEGGATCTISRR